MMNERPRGRELGNSSREWSEEPDDEADDSPAIVVTFFTDFTAATKREQALDLTDLARQIEITTGPDKAHLPWLKCARFGDIRTDKNSLRWDGNLLAITGIEADYDAEEISFDTAHDKLGDAGILSIIYTSPSHTEDTPRWRVLCPLSQEYPPDRRDAFLARLNGLLGGIFSRESWTRSQSYYFGSVNSNPSHRVAVLAGKPIDQAVELDAIAIGKPVRPESMARPAYPAADPSKITDKRVNGKIESLLDNIRAAQDQQKHYTLWDNALALGGYLHLAGWTDEQAVAKCIAALPSAEDWNLARRTAAEAIAKGRLKPLHLEERPLPPRRTGNGAAPPPPPDAPAGPEPYAEPSAEWDQNAPPPPDEDDPGSGSPPPHADNVLEAIKQLGPDLTLKALVYTFNQKYAVANEGGKALVMWTTPDPQMRRDRIERASFDDFRKFYCNHQFTVTVTAGGKAKKITKTFAEWWLNHPNRRQYLGGVVFNPSGPAAAGSLNLWRGWTVSPSPGDWSLMAAHIHNVICGGRGDIASYVLRWLAHMIQHPDQQAEVAIVLRGEKGIGKGIFGKWLLRLCGQHGLHIINAAHLTGHFTGHLRDVIFVFADEALYAGDKQHEGILKGIITEGSLLIEAKYRTPVMVANMLHLILSSNNDWVVPASHDERRYLMLDVSSLHQRDFAYFAALDAQMENGGLAAMLHELTTLDLGDFRPREVPDTPELADQKLLSLDTPARWWLAMLARGFVWRSRYGHADFLRWHEFVTTELLTRSYAQWCQENRVIYPAHRTGLGRMLAAIYPPGRPRSPCPVYEADSVDPQNPQPVVKLPFQHGYKLGDLDSARTRFRNAFGLTSTEWDSPVEDAAP
jgi:Family of unknown function (DUF5906)